MNLRTQVADTVGAESMDEAAAAECQACGASDLIGFYEIESVPAQTCVLLESEAEAEGFPVGSLLLAFCESCGFIQNTRFAQELVDYSMPTEESQAFSPRFNEFANGLADSLVDRFGLEGRAILEIGCGKGDFLQLLAERGIRHGVGIDPGYLANREDLDARLEFLREWYDLESSQRTADFVMSRHLMEHVPNVGEFFGWLRESTAATPGATLFTEVPDTRRVLEEGAFWDVYHEHCSYFTAGSLARTLRGAGMTVDNVAFGFDDQYLLAESRPGVPGSPLPVEESVTESARLVAEFALQATQRLDYWRDLIGETQSHGGHVALWGGGSKAVAFLTSTGASDLTVVDINPHKQGKWLPGAGVEVQDPAVLNAATPNLVVVMNPIYTTEITRDLEIMGLCPRVEAI